MDDVADELAEVGEQFLDAFGHRLPKENREELEDALEGLE